MNLDLWTIFVVIVIVLAVVVIGLAWQVGTEEKDEPPHPKRKRDD